MSFLDKTIDLKRFNPSLINYINEVVRNNIFGTTTIILDSTKGLTSEMLKMIISSNRIKFRIKGAYDDTRIEYNKGKTFLMDGKLVPTEDTYIEPVLYSRNELYNILLKIENLEKSIKPEYSDLEKTILIYELLRKYFNLEDNKVGGKIQKTLRGFINKTLDYNGFALLLKELLERQNIRCDYVEGLLVDGEYKMPHAWNIVYVDGKFIPADLAHDVLEYNYSHKSLPSYFGEINSFAETHIPNEKENIQYYQNALTPISDQTILEIKKRINDAVNNKNPIIEIKGNNNDYLISIVGQEKIGDKNLNKIVYYDKINDEYINPTILYTDTDLMISNGKILIDGKEVNDINQIEEKMFNKVNITTSVTTSNGYLGKLVNSNGNLEYVFTPNIKDNINYSQKSFIRSDKSKLVLEQRVLSPKELGLNSYEYYSYELLRYIDGLFIKEDHLFTEKDIFSDSKSSIGDEFLSRKHIEDVSLNNNGYLGYHNPNEIKIVEKVEGIQKNLKL